MQADLKEAERRIEEARRTGAESLDLGDLALDELPASLGDLPHLKALHLGVSWLNKRRGLEWIFRRVSPGFTDLTPLAGLQGLQRLDLSVTHVTDLAPLAGLQGLQGLDLSATHVTDLAPLAGLQGLQSLYLNNTQVTDLAPLAGLQGLQTLELRNTKVSELAPLAGLQRLQTLDLLRSGVTDLAPLARLQGLQKLDLSGTGVAELAPLERLQSLQSLDLIECRAVADFAPLARLQGLQNLDLTWTGVTDLASLAGLQELRSLSLMWCVGVSDVAPLAGLQRLQSLNLSFTGIDELAPLMSLKRLQNLNLSNTDVEDLPLLAEFQGLRSLSLHGYEELDLSPLSGLRDLQALDLWGAGVTDLSPLDSLQNLQSLNLAGSKVNDLSPLSTIQSLQSLDLARTCVTDLSPLYSLQNLQSLDLAKTSVPDLSSVARLRELVKLSLFRCRPVIPNRLLRALADHPRLSILIADEALGVPQEVLSHHESDNCLPRVRSYLAELDLGSEAENDVKVILLGNGRVGKTQLCRRFRGEPFDKDSRSTHGVQIWRKALRIQIGGEEQIFQVNWWDFGGQDIYHGTHALFLRSRAVFLILWTPELENREGSEENGIPLRNQPLPYWLDYVRSLAGEGSPVIVVQSQCDRFADRRPSPARPDGLGFYESCSYSAKNDLGRDALEAHLRDAIRSLLERNGAQTIGHGRAELRRRFFEWLSEDQKRQPGERQHRTITLADFQTLCEEVGGIVSWEHALDYLHHTGVVFYQPDLFSARIVLDQTWALDAVYTVFDRDKTAPWLRDSGRFTREDLARMIWQEYSVEEQRLFLGLMKSCGVCFPCGKAGKGEPRYVAPDLLPGFKTVAGRLHAWKEEAMPTLRLEYRFLHPAVIRNLMSEVGRKAGDLAEYWKYGLWFKDGQRDAQLLVQWVDTSTDAAPGAGALELKAQGRDPQGLFQEIRQAILRQRLGEEPEELLTLDGTTVARSALAHVVDLVCDIHGSPVSAAPFTAFFGLPARETPGLDISPRRLTVDEKPREVFISYAWGDDSSDGKSRTEAVEGLCSALEADGFLPVRDRDQIHPGDLISAFINRLTHADLVVAVVSDKYLRSPYCMYEIYKLWQRVQGDGADLAKCLVPIVLPGVRIKSLRDRVVYMEYWAEEAEGLEALVRNPKLKPSRESWEEVRLVREFAHHVDGILVFLNDVLMERGLEVHLDNDFAAVRAALRRRMGERG